MAISGINHATLRVRDLNKSDYFYTQVLGLKHVGQRALMRFYSSGKFAHELALMQDSNYQHTENDGLMHLCFNAPDEDGLHALHQRCLAHGLAVSNGVDHIVMHSFYVRDPDGYVIEIGLDRPLHEWADHPEPFAEDYALDLSGNN